MKSFKTTIVSGVLLFLLLIFNNTGHCKTLAILPFENNSVTDTAMYAPLAKGLSAMLITDLNTGGSTLKIIERGKIQAAC